ncbi:MAG: DUF6438 domain-containing protein [Bacteroidota bacterium]
MAEKLTLGMISMVLICIWGCSPKMQVQEQSAKVVDVPQPIVDTMVQVVEEAPITMEEAELVARIQKTPCFGQCPVYKLSFFDNRTAVLKATRFVEKLEGVYTAKIDPSFYKRLEQELEKCQYFNLSPTYPYKGEMIKDIPNTVTTIDWDGKSHKITNNHDAPALLLDFEKFLASYLKELDWEKRN